ncbi:MAG: acyltransferase domain-containing protein, partial [Actinocatenispora sp.]
PWTVSARGVDALRAQAGRLLEHLVDHPGVRPLDVGHSLVTTRSAFEHRAVLVGDDRDELTGGLAALAAGEQADTVVRGIADVDGRTVFVFPGQGSQWAGMAVELLDTEPVFAARLAECADALRPYVDWSLFDVLREEPGAPGLDRVDVVQPASFAVMVALAALWQSAGVRPEAVVGHSQGEIAAACVAGVLSLDDAARVVALRSRAIVALAGEGGMVSLGLPAEQVVERIAGYGGRISVAAYNGPRSTVVSGEPAALDELVAACETEEIRARRVAVDYASHSAQVERIEDALAEALAPVRSRQAEIPMFSTLTGEWLTPGDVGPDYWYRNLRHTVRFERAVRGLLADGFRTFVECSAHPVLGMAVQETVEAVGTEDPTVVIGSLRRGEGGRRRFRLSLAEAYVRGAAVDWSTIYGPHAPRRVELPTYAFQGQRYWLADVLTAPSELPVDRVDAQFWEAVESQQLERLADTLVVDESALGQVLPALSAWRRQRREQSTVDSWRYRVTWKPVPQDRAAGLTGQWLVVLPAGLETDETVSTVLSGLERFAERIGTVAVPATGADRASVAGLV